MEMGIAVGGATVTPGLISLPGRVEVRLTVRSVDGTRRGRVRYAVAEEDPWKIGGAKEMIGPPFPVGTGGTIVVADVPFNASRSTGTILLNIFVAELDSDGQPGPEDGTSVTIGVRSSRTRSRVKRDRR